ncbi:thyroid stimulating hormone subunit beta a isoform X3 [Syngnathoides biaculeatus]|uniref:thyroid stimulating hormone subunit beta a isoform X3 n=1 Tax=Syngnathoides biaculeatus TaxID=300417 RepID=UPI002ADE086B|nr:thyroid stimulating hormone subunit beta a isoform X3 [Syngnathoides biaculeatus]
MASLRPEPGLNMNAVVFTCCLLLLLCSSAAPMCIASDYTLYVEKPECDFCVAINTTICMGFCYSKDSNIRDIFGSRFVIQKGCTYDKVEYRTTQLPGCPGTASATFTYPVAISCHCGACRTDTDECAHRADVGGAACTKPVRRLYPYPDDYMLPF